MNLSVWQQGAVSGPGANSPSRVQKLVHWSYVGKMAADGVYTYFKPSDPEGLRDPTIPVTLGPSEMYTFAASIKNISLIYGWDTAGFDLDAAAAIFNGKLECIEFIWWDNPRSQNGAIGFVSKDNLAGKGPGDKEAIKVDFHQVPDEVTHILLATSIYSKDIGLENVKSMSLRVVDQQKVLCTYSIATNFQGTSMILGILVRKGSWWSLVTVKQPVLARTITEVMYESTNLDVVRDLDASPLVHKRLLFAIRKARNLTNMDTELLGNKKKCSPCMVIIHKGKRYESDIVTNSYSPAFSMAPVDLGEATLSDASLIEVQCIHKEEGQEDTWLGVVKVCVGGLAARDVGTHSIWLPLSATKHKKDQGMVVTGTVMLEVTLKNLYPRA